jgi:PAS domain S-box-containing protein
MDVNPSAENLYGYNKEELLGMKITDLSADPKATTSTFINRLAYVPLRYHKNKDGDIFPITATVSFFKEKNGIENEYAVVMCRLITPEIKKEICDE